VLPVQRVLVAGRRRPLRESVLVKAPVARFGLLAIEPRGRDRRSPSRASHQLGSCPDGYEAVNRAESEPDERVAEGRITGAPPRVPGWWPLACGAMIPGG
jgi:hypothetical protein